MDEMIHSLICGREAAEAAGAPKKANRRSDRVFGAVVGLIILAAIILRLAAAELVPGWVAIPVIAVVLCIVGVLYGYGLRQASEKK